MNLRRMGAGLSVVAWIVVAAHALGASLEIGAPAVEATRYVFPVVLTGIDAPIAALNFQILYDPEVFSPSGVNPGQSALRGGKQVVGNVPAPGRQIVLAMSFDGAESLRAGEVALVAFDRIRLPESGQTQVVLADPTLSDGAGNELPVSGSGRTVPFADAPKPSEDGQDADSPEGDADPEPAPGAGQPQQTRGRSAVLPDAPLEVAKAIEPAPKETEEAVPTESTATVDPSEVAAMMEAAARLRESIATPEGGWRRLGEGGRDADKTKADNARESGGLITAVEVQAPTGTVESTSEEPQPGSREPGPAQDASESGEQRGLAWMSVVMLAAILGAAVFLVRSRLFR